MIGALLKFSDSGRTLKFRTLGYISTRVYVSNDQLDILYGILDFCYIV